VTDLIPSLHRFLLDRLSPRGERARLMIFTFHRILEQPDPLMADEPDRAQFTQMLSWIREVCEVLPLGEAVAALRSGKLPSRAAAITFDDGYRNNLTLAKPLLVEAGLPATVFIAVDAVRTGVMWNDVAIEAARRWDAGVDLSDLGFDTQSLQAAGGAGRVDVLITGLKYRAIDERAEVVAEIFRRTCGGSPERLMLCESEVAQLAGDGIELGAHTIHHPILTRIPDDLAREEIQDSRNWLHEVTGRAPALFAYPNGRPGTDYDQRHVAMVADAGFNAAVSTRWGAARANSEIFELPRFLPWERTRDAFCSRLVKVCLASYDIPGRS
jgi:peptidoglycan/xylan/chitin deacetylase (PgdA/CDA1 family)